MSFRRKEDSVPVQDYNNSRLVHFLRASRPVSAASVQVSDVDQKIAYILAKVRRNKELRTMVVAKSRQLMTTHSVKAKRPYEKFLGLNLLALKNESVDSINEIYEKVQDKLKTMEASGTEYDSASEDDYFSAMETITSSLARKGLSNPFFVIDTRRFGRA